MATNKIAYLYCRAKLSMRLNFNILFILMYISSKTNYKTLAPLYMYIVQKYINIIQIGKLNLKPICNQTLLPI